MVKKRYAFTMIELIFAIIVIALMLLSLPMMTDVASKGSERNMEFDEAVFEAYVKAVEATDQTFDSLSSVGPTAVWQVGARTSKTGFKFAHNYAITVTSPATFGGITSDNIKKVTLTIFDSRGNIITRLNTYKFNM